MGSHEVSLDAEVRKFISAHLDDVETVELLLLLHRKRVSWTSRDAADELGLEWFTSPSISQPVTSYGSPRSF